MASIDADLVGIANLMRRHIEIRNRSWMKRIHRDCFIGSEAVDFLVTQGFADTRKAGVEMGFKMCTKKIIRNITDSRKFSDSLHYYRFAEDDTEDAVLAQTNAGNGTGLTLGHGGCKFSFAPHTAHNSYVMDIGLAEEIERAVAGPSIEARAMAINKLRSRVREQAEADAPNWDLVQTTNVNNSIINVFQRKRPRGDWKNVKMTGAVAETPIGFIKSIMSFDKRRQWESMFEDGVIVEAIDIGEKPGVLLEDEEELALKAKNAAAGKAGTTPATTGGATGAGGVAGGIFSAIKNAVTGGGKDSNTPVKDKDTSNKDQKETIALPDSVLKQKNNKNVARATDDVYTFLETVDLAGIPQGMAIAFLNDPDRQHALAHLRKQMMLANPQECMLCQTSFESATDIRFCPCCAMVSCAGCVSKRVFEVVSRNVMNVCVHCYRESSRIFQPPQAVQDSSNIDQALRGKWWRPEELGIVDYSTMNSALKTSQTPSSASTATNSSAGGAKRLESVAAPSLYNDQDMLVLTGNIVPLIPGLLDDLDQAAIAAANAPQQCSPIPPSGTGADSSDAVSNDVDKLSLNTDVVNAGHSSSPSPIPMPPSPPPVDREKLEREKAEKERIEKEKAEKEKEMNAKFARCKGCGMLISRDMEAIEAHMEECSKTNAPTSAPKGGGKGERGFRSSIAASIAGPVGGGVGDGNETYTISPDSSTISVFHGNHKQFAGIPRKPDLAKKYSTRIIFRTARRTGSGGVEPREVCALQDSFVDPDGSAFLYEISVRHSDVRGLPDYITADVILLMHVARPIKGNKTASMITIINQIDTHSKGGYTGWVFGGDGEKSRDIAGLRKEDLVRELKMCGDLPNLLNNPNGASNNDYSDESLVSLDDFELLAVLGRGGFGKVMQVRHKTTNQIYAMKILKKTELRRRRQVERTQTERTILANVRHPFIVCLHYAFQNAQKLYMVMDFVQGGDFFTFMRKFRRLPEDWVRLYVLQVAMALQHLHDREIVYRDLKPENILLCADGHLKLTDFGLSRYFETRPPNPEDIVDQQDNKDDVVTRSFCGTEQYMSPEMLLQQGHNYRMDWWCLGLLMHEMIAGKHPFLGNTHYDTLRNMVTRPPTIDPRLSPPAAAVVKSLLIKNPRSRLGGKDGINELKNIPWFNVVNWDDLVNLKIDMPYKPKLQGETDISSFETTFTKEKPIDSVPDPANGRNGDADRKKGGKGGGLFGAIFGGGNGNKNNPEEMSDADAFKGFSFTKEEDASTFASAVNAAEAGNTA